MVWYKIDNIIMKSENNKTYHLNGLLLNLPDKIN